MSEIFISYARSTAMQAQAVAEALRGLGYGVWRDDDLPAHRPYGEVIQERLLAAKAVVVVWSAEAAKSEWVQSEADRARADHKLIQLRIDDASLPMPFDRIQCADLTSWTGERDAHDWRKVVESVAELVGPAPKRRRRSTAKPTEATLVATPAAPAAPIAPPPRRPWAWVAMAAVVLAVAAGGVWLLVARPFAPTSAPAVRVAVLPFDAAGQSPDAQRLADAATSQISDALAANQIELLPRADSATLRSPTANAEMARLGVGLVLDGEVRSSGQTLEVRVHLTDARARATLWSKSFAAPVQEAEVLRARVAARATEVTGLASDPTVASIRSRPDILATYIDDVDEFDERFVGRSLAISRDLVARAPDFSLGHSFLSNMLALNAWQLPAAAQAQSLAEATKEAQVALDLDPNNGWAYSMQAYMTPYTDWREREHLLLKGLAVQPNSSVVHMIYSWSLRNSGRSREALAQAQQAVAVSPWDSVARFNLALSLLEVGQGDQAASAAAEARRLQPGNLALLYSELWVATLSAPPTARVLAILDDPLWKSGSSAGLPGILRPVYRAVLSGGVADKKGAAAGIEAAGVDDVIGPINAIGALSNLGDVDSAFHAAEQFSAPANVRQSMAFEPFDTDALFAPSGAAMRRDRRFMALAARLGLIDYWRTSGHWPDFCAEPGLPYDCKAEAAKLSATAHY